MCCNLNIEDSQMDMINNSHNLSGPAFLYINQLNNLMYKDRFHYSKECHILYIPLKMNIFDNQWNKKCTNLLKMQNNRLDKSYNIDLNIIYNLFDMQYNMKHYYINCMEIGMFYSFLLFVKHSTLKDMLKRIQKTLNYKNNQKRKLYNLLNLFDMFRKQLNYTNRMLQQQYQRNIQSCMKIYNFESLKNSYLHNLSMMQNLYMLSMEIYSFSKIQHKHQHSSKFDILMYMNCSQSYSNIHLYSSYN